MQELGSDNLIKSLNESNGLYVLVCAYSDESFTVHTYLDDVSACTRGMHALNNGAVSFHILEQSFSICMEKAV